jgi:uncharacterized protein YcbK (DUF882 family)
VRPERLALPPPSPARQATLVALALLASAAIPAPAAAGRPDCDGTRTVEAGDSLWSIARECWISVTVLRGLNGLSADDSIRPGQRLRMPPSGLDDDEQEASTPRRAGPVPAIRPPSPPVEVALAEGQTLEEFAAAHGTTVEALVEANAIEDPARVEPGARLRLPAGAGAAPYREITFIRQHGGAELTLRMFDDDGAPAPDARDRMTDYLRERGANPDVAASEDLLRLVQAVADHWPDRVLVVHSGIRGAPRRRSRSRSNHLVGRAVDFHVDGISNQDLRDFCRTLDHAGVGYYPNSTFVHLDARDPPWTWVDSSGPGERAQYTFSGPSGPAVYGPGCATGEPEADPGPGEADPGIPPDGAEPAAPEAPPADGSASR